MVSTSDRSALSLIDGLFAGEKLSLSRAITAIENGHDAGLEILGAIQDHIGGDHLEVLFHEMTMTKEDWEARRELSTSEAKE